MALWVSWSSSASCAAICEDAMSVGCRDTGGVM